MWSSGYYQYVAANQEVLSARAKAAHFSGENLRIVAKYEEDVNADKQRQYRLYGD